MCLNFQSLFRLPFCVLWLCAATFAQAETVTVFAAASLKTVLDDLRPTYEAEAGHSLRLVYAGSSSLARQIAQGAPADVFVSANISWMDSLEEQGRIKPESRVDLVGNQLVLVSAQSGPMMQPTELVSQSGRIAMGLVEAVPAGIYGKQALTHYGLWESLEERIVQSDNVRTALALVARGEAAFGIVYKSDAAVEPRVHLRAVFADNSHTPIIYPAALTSLSGEAGAIFLQFLLSAQAQDSFVKQGFSVLAAPQ